MIRVICINANQDGVHAHGLVEGNTYTASDLPEKPNSYHIHEHPFTLCCGIACSFAKHRVLLLSEIDEMELVNAKNETV